jgi:hypothetical protein
MVRLAVVKTILSKTSNWSHIPYPATFYFHIGKKYFPVCIQPSHVVFIQSEHTIEVLKIQWYDYNYSYQPSMQLFLNKHVAAKAFISLCKMCKWFVDLMPIAKHCLNDKVFIYWLNLYFKSLPLVVSKLPQKQNT